MRELSFLAGAGMRGGQGKGSSGGRGVDEEGTEEGTDGEVGREGGRVIWVGEEKREGRRRMGI